jgi:hypothetical protein
MNIEAVLEDLVRLGDSDWIGLWLIAACVAEDLKIEDLDETSRSSWSISGSGWE